MTGKSEMSTGAVTREISITRFVAAPRDSVFRAWTEAEHLSRWWGPEGFTNPVCESDPRPGGAIRIVMRGPDGAQYPMAGVYREVVAPERLVVDSIAEDGTGRAALEAVTTVTFAEREGGTEVVVRETATTLIPEGVPMLGGMEAGMSQSLQRLEDVLTGAVDRQFVLMRLIEAPRDLVFRAWTQREHVQRWWGPAGFAVTITEMDVRPGGSWRFVMHGPDGADHQNVIRYEEVAPPQRLVYTHEDPSFRTIVTFDDFMGSTVLTMRNMFPTAQDRDRAAARYDAVNGANQTLDRLAEHAHTMR